MTHGKCAAESRLRSRRPGDDTRRAGSWPGSRTGRDRSFENQRELHRRIAGSLFHIIEGAGHCCNVEKPWDYDEAVLDFLRRGGLR